MPTDAQNRMAMMLNLNPETPDDWPMDTIDWLIEREEKAPLRTDFEMDLRAVLRRHWRS